MKPPYSTKPTAFRLGYLKQEINNIDAEMNSPSKIGKVNKMKVCTVHDAHSSEVRRAEALLGIFLWAIFRISLRGSVRVIL